MRRVGVIGGGPAGAICAQTLASEGVKVTVLDKGRRAGGRLSTRTYQAADFDHGAQYMTVRDQKLSARVDRWHEVGVVAPWLGPVVTLGENSRTRPSKETRWVGVPGMSNLVAHLLRDTDCRFEVRATALRRVGNEIEVQLESGESMRFDIVIVAVPTPQAIPLVRDWNRLSEELTQIHYEPCWAAMAEFTGRYPGTWSSAQPENSPIAWIARNQSKPGRPEREAWVIHATAAWSLQHMERPRDFIAETLMACARGLTGWDETPLSLRAHRWRYARVTRPLGSPFLFEDGVGVCGDGLLGGRIECALLSGVAMAEHIVDTM